MIYIPHQYESQVLDFLEENSIPYKDETLGHINLVDEVDCLITYDDIDVSMLSVRQEREMYEYVIDGILDTELCNVDNMREDIANWLRYEEVIE